MYFFSQLNCTPELARSYFSLIFIKIKLVADIPFHFLSPPSFVSEAYAVNDLHERLAHGRQLKIFLPKSVEKLEFTPADDPGKTFLYWEKGRLRSVTSRNTSCSACRQDGHGGKLWDASSVVAVHVFPRSSCFRLLQDNQRQGVWHRQWPTLVHRQGNKSHLCIVCQTEIQLLAGCSWWCFGVQFQVQVLHRCPNPVTDVSFPSAIDSKTP